ncbi:metallophosphoesterase [Rivibacter subsaxonicus]|uniref:Calcineurin-like phosphoesterase family protein n=1 Tax=Rivibacter subsaxonicus TaxID=457575 RepID=A0A4Q7VW84_9BURK|nr:metallophosphoesterase [Rivibacter subsaxonicus]RZU00755.1 calcineurin-like phosphoesterase family protein [Rivibacter subsaxonicus]
MRLQLLSDLHLETEAFEPRPAPQAELLVLAGDIDSSWRGLELFANWPVPVLFVAGNHEFDRRDLELAWPALRARCEALGIRLLQRETCIVEARDGRRVRFVGTTRWSDFDVFGESQRERAMRAARYYVAVMRATRGGAVFDAAAVREEGLACRAWLESELARPAAGWDQTVVITHFAPSLRSADPRYGRQPGTASFCNADDDLLPRADLWLHGHLHCRHDYRIGTTRVFSNARGHAPRGEAEGHDPLFCVEP